MTFTSLGRDTEQFLRRQRYIFNFLHKVAEQNRSQHLKIFENLSKNYYLLPVLRCSDALQILIEKQKYLNESPCEINLDGCDQHGTNIDVINQNQDVAKQLHNVLGQQSILKSLHQHSYKDLVNLLFEKLFALGLQQEFKFAHSECDAKEFTHQEVKFAIRHIKGCKSEVKRIRHNQLDLKFASVHVISFIAQLYPTYNRFFEVSMQQSFIAYKRYNFWLCCMLMIFEQITLYSIHQFAVIKFRLPFFVKQFINATFAIYSLFVMFIGLGDNFFSWGLLMRYGADLPHGYYILYPAIYFDTTLPTEGRPPPDMAKGFAMHIFHAYHSLIMRLLIWIGFIVALWILRLVYEIVVRHLIMLPVKHKPLLGKKVKVFISVITILTFMYYLLGFSADSMGDIAPHNWYFYRTSINQQMPLKQYQQAIKLYREKFILAQGDEWIDQRPIPQFPLVHGPKIFADAYNHKIIAEEPPSQAQGLPNIVVLLMESLTPMPKYVKDDVLLNTQNIYNGQPYRETYLPNLAKFAESGHTFLGVRSNGVPTINGWHDFISGEPSNYKHVNMVKSPFNDMDDFPSKLHQMGYFTHMNWPSAFKADKKFHYVYRGRNQIRGPKHLENFPVWFDEVHDFFPTKEEADKMGISDYPDAPSYWTSDRISSQVFAYQFLETYRKINGSQPIFGFWGNVDTHEDYTGHDDAKQYEQFKVGVGQSDPYSVYGMTDAYSTVLRYADHHIGILIEKLRKEMNNTIILLVGDHGTRQTPIYPDPDKKINDESEIYFDDNCNHRSVGNEQQFTTSAILAYTGNNSKILEQFNGLLNKTSFLPADHQDIVETVLEMVYKLGAKKLPSGRLGSNILEQAQNLVYGHPVQLGPRVSATHLNFEYSDSLGHYRLNLYGKDDGYKLIKPMPVCIKGKDGISSNVEDGAWLDGITVLKLVNYLTENNRLYNYKFRNTECLPTGTCEFPIVNPVYHTPVVGKMHHKICSIAVKLIIYWNIIFGLTWCLLHMSKIVWRLIKKGKVRNGKQ